LRANSFDIAMELTVDRATGLGSSEFGITGGRATFQIGPSQQRAMSIDPVDGREPRQRTQVLELAQGSGQLADRRNFTQAEKIVVEAINGRGDRGPAGQPHGTRKD
jgi:hypothetical protein